MINTSAVLPAVLTEISRVNSDFLALPFDMARETYAKSVRAGLVERSLIASARFEHAISALERLTLGCLARG
ncbi:MAG: hypothetical protein HXX19_15645 [Rhodoferax sp.]|nr:hypothetical protein [Rhodoferax sp.]